MTAIDRDSIRVRDLAAVSAGGVSRLRALRADATELPFATGSHDGVGLLEVLEHMPEPEKAAAEAVRVAKRFVVASVPSRPDDNPEHIQLFSPLRLERLLLDAGAARVGIDHVRGHLVAVASLAPQGQRANGDSSSGDS